MRLGFIGLVLHVMPVRQAQLDEFVRTVIGYYGLSVWSQLNGMLMEISTVEALIARAGQKVVTVEVQI